MGTEQEKRSVLTGALPFIVSGLDEPARGLLVHLELGVAVLEEGIDLLGSSDTSVDVGLGCLGTH